MSCGHALAPGALRAAIDLRPHMHVLGPIDLAHAPGADPLPELVRSQSFARPEHDFSAEILTEPTDLPTGFRSRVNHWRTAFALSKYV
jgi:hypothetical protein